MLRTLQKVHSETSSCPIFSKLSSFDRADAEEQKEKFKSVSESGN